MSKKGKKKESWKEKRRRAALKRERALKAERIRREREREKKPRGWPRGKVFGVLFLISLFLISYGVWQYTQPPIQSSSPTPSPPPNENKAPSFTLTDIDGETFSLADFRGKVVVLDLFRIVPECPPCTEEVPELAEIHKQYGSNNVVILSISVSPYDTVELLQQYRNEHQISWRIAGDTDDVSDKYNVIYIPTLVIVDQSGTIYYRNEGLTDALTLSSQIDSLLSS